MLNKENHGLKKVSKSNKAGGRFNDTPESRLRNMALTCGFVFRLDWHDTLMARAYPKAHPEPLKRLARGVALALVGSLCLAQPTSEAQKIAVKDIDPYLYSIKIIGFQESSCLWRIAKRESNIRWNAVNRSSGASGAFQFMSPHFKTMHPNKQIEKAVEYAFHRYGGVCKAWDAWKVQRWW